VLGKVKSKIPALEMQSAKAQQDIIANSTSASSSIAQLIATIRDLKAGMESTK